MGLIGKKVKVFFNDNGRVLMKQGHIIEESPSYTIILERTTGITQAIPTINVVRMEVQK